MEKLGIMICGHGSRSKTAEQEFGLLARGLKQRFPETPVEYGFLEYSAPNIHMGLDELRNAGVNHIVAVPGMLFAATHAKNDIPSVLTTYQKKFQHLKISYGRELALHPKMIAAFEARILRALGRDHVHPGDLYDTMLVVVGRGTSDTYANAEAAKLTRIVTENLGFGWSETVYSGVTFPSVGKGLEMALKLGYKDIVVAPYFLFSGKLIDRIYNYVDRVALTAPDVNFVKAHYLADQDHVISTFVDRIEEAKIGSLNPAPSHTKLLNPLQGEWRTATGTYDMIWDRTSVTCPHGPSGSAGPRRGIGPLGPLGAPWGPMGPHGTSMGPATSPFRCCRAQE